MQGDDGGSVGAGYCDASAGEAGARQLPGGRLCSDHQRQRQHTTAAAEACSGGNSGQRAHMMAATGKQAVAAAAVAGDGSSSPHMRPRQQQVQAASAAESVCTFPEAGPHCSVATRLRTFAYGGVWRRMCSAIFCTTPSCVCSAAHSGVRIHQLYAATLSYLRLRAATCGYLRLPAATCGYLRLPAGTCSEKQVAAFQDVTSLRLPSWW
eukprot:345214-Chlamydomonas_euryale.AAC.1